MAEAIAAGGANGLVKREPLGAADRIGLDVLKRRFLADRLAPVAGDRLKLDTQEILLVEDTPQLETHFGWSSAAGIPA